MKSNPMVPVEVGMLQDELAVDDERKGLGEADQRLRQHPGVVGLTWPRVEAGSGFPEVVEAPIDVFLERYDRYAAVPWVTKLGLYDATNSNLRDFVSRAWNPHWVELDLQQQPMAGVIEYVYESTPGLLAIANSPIAQQLRALQFTLFDFAPPVIQAFATSPYLADLRRLLIWSSNEDRNAPGFAAPLIPLMMPLSTLMSRSPPPAAMIMSMVSRISALPVTPALASARPAA